MTCRTPPFWSCGESSSWSSWPASLCTGGFASSSSGPREMEALGWWGVPLAVLGGAIRASTPFLFVSLGECLTEKSGRLNLGLEGTLVLAPVLLWALNNTRWGLAVRAVGDSADAARAMGYPVNRVRLLSTVAGGFLAGIGGSFLSLYYPGSWNEALSSGQGLMAVALVIFARWDPVLCFFAALLFGGAGALGPALQSVGITWGYYLFNAAPYVLTLLIMIATSSTRRTLIGAPGELSVTN